MLIGRRKQCTQYAAGLVAALGVAGGAVVAPGATRIPGIYDPATKTFRLFPEPAPDAAAATLYQGVVQITVDLSTALPVGTQITANVTAYVADPVYGVSDSVRGAITATAGVSTAKFSIPYLALVTTKSDKIVVNLEAYASYKDGGGQAYNPAAFASATVAFPNKSGVVTPVTVAGGM